MRDPGVSLAAAEPDHPFAEDRRIDERVAPERVVEDRVAPDDVADARMRDEGELRRHERADAVVHDLEMQALQVGEVARRVERHDLPLAAVEELVAADEAFEDEAALGRLVLVADDVLVGGEALHRHRQGEQRLLVVGGEVGDALELADQPMAFRRRAEPFLR